LSDYHIFYTNAADDLLAVLSQSLGIDVRIIKKRTLFLWKNVRIHLDCVEGLGDFIEFEAVLNSDYHQQQAQEDLAFLKNLFTIVEKDLIGSGYYELVKNNKGQHTCFEN
jgi:adenylate cyclase, class 2